MNKLVYIILFISTSLFAGGDDPSTNSSKKKNPLRAELVNVDRLINKMTLEEKVGQMTQINIDVISVGEVFNLVEPHSLSKEKLEKAIKEYHVGSFLNAGGHAYELKHWQDILTEIQTMALNDTRLGVPIVYGIDAIHGAGYLKGGTLFPQPLAQAATFNRDLVREGAAITAYETKACGIPWNFSPVLDVARNPLWSRVFETYGEDVYLCTEMGEACVQGYQGDDPSAHDKLAATLKHFLGYSFSYTGKDRTPVHMHERTMREIFLPPFQSAIDQGALSIMINSGDINGIPVHADKAILTDLLRDELGFEGVAVTDWEDIMKLHNIHMVAKDMREAVKLAVLAGVDMSMTPLNYTFNDHLIDLVNDGEVPIERIDEAVRRILNMKVKLGLFDNPLPFETNDYQIGGKRSMVASYKTAAEAITLLKNQNNILPLATESKLLVAGAAADSRIMLNGPWTRTWQGTDPKYDDPSKKTIREAIEFRFLNAQFADGCTVDSLPNLDETFEMSKDSKYAVVCLGETPSTEKPGDIDELSYEQAQLDLVKQLHENGKKIILVLVQNRPRLIREIEPLCDAILLAYQPGDEGGMAVADIIAGKVNPSGKLPFTYPKHSNTLLTYDHKKTERLDQSFGLNAFQPQYEFGHGLSYSTFSYSNIDMSSDTLRKGESIKVEITVINESPVAGKESVLLFSSDRVASIVPSVKRLRGFEKKEIPAGGSETYSFKLSQDDLRFVGIDNKWTLEEGWFDVMIGDKKASFYYKP